MKISLICTVLNEGEAVENFLHSILSQTKNPDELIIVDGGSTDDTYSVIKIYESRLSRKTKFQLLRKHGNRSVGRNEAVKHAAGDIIACTDAGNTLDKDWLKNITEPFKDKSIDVVAGYYKGLAENTFQKSLIPYVLVMPDKVDPNNFLPAARSVAFRKTIWEKAGKFDEKYSHNEDYVFAKKLKKIGAKIVFAKNAIVYWIPRNNLRQSFYMFFRFAYGDSQAGIFRPKVLLIFLRYFLVAVLIILFINNRSYIILNTLYLILFIYLFWAIQKNYKYIKDWRAFYILPLLQFTSDVAVLTGTVFGFFKLVKFK